MYVYHMWGVVGTLMSAPADLTLQGVWAYQDVKLHMFAYITCAHAC